MRTDEDRDVLDQLESDLLAVEAALDELDRLTESAPRGHSGDGDGSVPPGTRDDGAATGTTDRRAAILAVVADQRFRPTPSDQDTASDQDGGSDQDAGSDQI